MMNNLGMNPMGMNPMQMNNMGMMGMNNQPNLMDQTALNVKSIIEPYENKIRELEEIIKQKDFEITVLKQKLNKNVSNNNLMDMNMNPMMNMNMNNPWMNANPMINMNPLMDMNMNNSFDNREKISILMKSNVNKTIECYKDEKASCLKKYLALTYNYEPIYDKTLGEYGISNGSIINIADKIYTVRFMDGSGISKILNLDGDCPVKKAIELYFKLINKENLYQKLLGNEINYAFIFNATVLNNRDETPIKNIFNLNNNPKVIVNEPNNLHGGKSKE